MKAAVISKAGGRIKIEERRLLAERLQGSSPDLEVIHLR